MLCAVVPRNRQRGNGFIVGPIGEVDVERRRPLARDAAVRGDHERRVDSTGQERRYRDVRHRLGRHGVEQRARGRLDGFPEGADGIGARLDPLVLAQVMPLRADGETTRLGESLDVREAGRRLRDVAEAQKVVAGLAVDRGPESRQREERLHLAREGPLAVVPREEQGLHPEAVSGEEHASRPTVVDREREDPAQAGDHLLAVFFVQVDQHLGVGGATEAVAAVLQLGREVPVVVDLAVEDDVHAGVLVRHRLVARWGEVDQRQAAVDELAVLVRPVPIAIGAPMREQSGGPGGPGRVGRQPLGVKPSR